MASFRNEKAFLSNFYKCKVKYEGLIYPSAENAYQASKTIDIEKRKEFQEITPVEAKRLGRRVVLRKDFEKRKNEIMWEILESKFNNKELKEKLIKTGQEYLEEKNTWGDTYWGTVNGKGENNLGKILMNIRNKYKITKDEEKKCDELVEKYLKMQGIKSGKELYYLYNNEKDLITTIKERFNINTMEVKDERLIELNNKLKEKEIEIYNEYKCEYVKEMDEINWDKYTLYKDGEEYKYESNEKKNELKKKETGNNKDINTKTKMAEYNYTLKTKTFEATLNNFFKWVSNEYSLVDKENNEKKEWDFDIIDEFDEPYRNKLEKFLEPVFEQYNVLDNDGDTITNSKDISIRFKEEVGNKKTTTKTTKTKKVVEEKKETKKKSLECVFKDLYELDDGIDEMKCEFNMKLYYSTNELIEVFGELQEYTGKQKNIEFMYKFNMNTNKYVIYKFTDEQNWLLGSNIVNEREHMYQVIELVQFIEKQGRVSSIKKKCKKLQESIIDMTNEKKEEEIEVEDESENEEIDSKKSIEEDANEKLDKMFKKLKV